ncbi:DNA-3-methyladenine glycosylase 2 family protein [Hydrogenophaga crocea]|uniref:DNA-3-methyladenine glycosylase II n=1 Tax=Hydrogenophaga crocea TaxID=2716225 RepID=A0A6G8ID10_9BURK|nr:Ada metal-binding domain-containing protein [Hydrogenophaga crocea]QIM50958.1 helix-turn-helix domain-containing protein [Hydrogenophaga crocea]
MDAPQALDDDARYLALCTRDARFDGRFFTGVTSTGIYCRPVCSVRTPRRGNCRFFEFAAQAERAGFRPCLRCRPELAPQSRTWSTQDAAELLVQHASRLLDDPAQWAGEDGPAMQRLAERLGVSDRHLRRVFEARLGVSPLQVLHTRRLLAAKQLLTDTALPITAVAQASGFSSLRRFNAALQERYGLSPTAMRRSGTPDAGSRAVALGWRPPLDVDALLAFLGARLLPGVDAIDPAGRRYWRTLRLHTATGAHSGWFGLRFEPERHRVWLHASDGLLPALPTLLWRVRALCDLDADPHAIDGVLGRHFPGGSGLRVPGAIDGFELAVRAVLGQQVTVAAARTLAGRLVAAFGEPIATPDAALNRLFPTPQALAEATPDALGALGIVRQRQAAIQALARAVAHGTLDLGPHANVTASTQALTALPGIGPWTAQYIAMRALRWPDAWPAADVALHHTLGLSGTPRERERACDTLAQAWKPWRSYAVLRAWAGLYAAVPPSAPDTPT